MPWYRINEPGAPLATAHINFGNRTPALSCVFPDMDIPSQRCARMVVALCDAPVSPAPDGKPRTCSAPMCPHHQTSVGPDRDLCPRCAAKQATEPFALSPTPHESLERRQAGRRRTERTP